MHRATTVLAVAALLALGSCTSSDGGTDGDPRDAATPASTSVPSTKVAPAEERIETAVVPLPAGLRGPRFPWWSADGERLLFSATPEGGSRVEIHSVRPDGSDLVCLTCGIATAEQRPLLKPIPFRDGRRVIVRVGNQNPLAAADHAILECTPSVARCDDAELVPFVAPAADDPSVTQDQRELRPAPDNEHIGFSQVRTSADGEATLVAAVGELRRTDDVYEVVDPRAVNTRGELKSFTPDGTAALVGVFTPGPFETANPDVIRIDLETGEEGRVTWAPDYDEPVEVAPDGRSYVVGSGRGSGLFETVSQVRRPSLLGTSLDPLTAYLFAHHRPELLEGWIVPIDGEPDGQLGQRLADPGDDYDGRAIYNWRPDGTAITWWEGRGSGFDADPVDTRLVIAELPDRDPSPAPGEVEVAQPRWAPSLAGLVPNGIEPARSRDGQDRGSVTVEVTPLEDGELVEVTYESFSDDGSWIVDGVERAERHGDRTTYVADLDLSGDHDGYLRADATISTGAIDGTITSSVDGRVLELPRVEVGG